mmetsp:Transcript_96421/g.272650  ORF Transcript_96421/g.272650 Transcript_96421/m.272650 type:complete len:461 (-) Transcript_96421:480-1862(-)
MVGYLTHARVVEHQGALERQAGLLLQLVPEGDGSQAIHAALHERGVHVYGLALAHDLGRLQNQLPHELGVEALPRRDLRARGGRLRGVEGARRGGLRCLRRGRQVGLGHGEGLVPQGLLHHLLRPLPLALPHEVRIDASPAEGGARHEEAVLVGQQRRLAYEAEGHALDVNVRVQLLEVEHWWQDVVLEQKNGLHQHRHAGVALAVALVRLACKELQHSVPFVGPVELLERTQFNGVPEVRTVALALRSGNLRGRYSCSPHGVLQQLALRRAAGRRDLGAAAVLHCLAGCPERSVALQLVRVAYHETPAALAHDVAVRVRVEGSRATNLGEQAAGATHGVHLRTQQCVDAKRKACLDLAPADVRRGHVRGDQRRRAACVDEDTRPGEPQRAAYAVCQHGHVAPVQDTGAVHEPVKVHAASVDARQRASQLVPRELCADEGAVTLLKAGSLHRIHQLGLCR